MNCNWQIISVVTVRFQKVTILCMNGDLLLCETSSFAIGKVAMFQPV